MSAKESTDRQLTAELMHLRQRVAELEQRLENTSSFADQEQNKDELFRKIIAESPIAIQLCDETGCFIDINQAGLNMIGMSTLLDYPHEWSGIFDAPFMPEEQKTSLLAGNPVRFDVTFDYDEAKRLHKYRGKNTGVSYYDVLVSPLGYEKGLITGYLFQMQDVTERKRAEISLQESEELFRSIYEQSPIAIQLCDPNGWFIAMNKASMEMFDIRDFTEYAWEGIFQGNYMPPKQRELLRQGDVVRYEVTLDFDDLRDRNLSGGNREGVAYYDVLVNALGLEQGTIRGYLSQIQDITFRKRAEIGLRELSRRLVEVQEMERRYIARELHDEIGQALTGLKLMVEMAARKAGTNIDLGLDDVKSLVNELMVRVSDLSLDLRPSMLDDLGLVATFLWHFERYRLQTGIKVVFKHSGLHQRFEPEVETTVYRIVQEALTNVARHAKVQKVSVQVLADDNTLTVEIQDHGIGFAPEEALAAGESSGLVGMSERAIYLGGQLMINSIPGRGTLLIAEIPIGISDEGEYDQNYDSSG